MMQSRKLKQVPTIATDRQRQQRNHVSGRFKKYLAQQNVLHTDTNCFFLQKQQDSLLDGTEVTMAELMISQLREVVSDAVAQASGLTQGSTKTPSAVGRDIIVRLEEN